VCLASPRQQALRYVYPLRYSAALVNEASKRGVDPLLIAAVTRVESHFDAKAVSAKGAIGLMQVMPGTGAWIAEKLRLRNWHENHLYDPYTNIKVGTWYLSYLISKFDGEVAPAVAAYNGGYTNVKRWLDNGKWDGTTRHSNHIPFPETRRYVTKVMRSYEWYRKAYPQVAQGELAKSLEGHWTLASRPSAGFAPVVVK
jgi:soluble lytic murein transglycosylase